MQNENLPGAHDFAYLDQASLRDLYSHGKSQNQICFYVSGIQCGKCIRKLEDLPLNLAGLKSLRVEMNKNLAYAEVDPKLLEFSTLAAAIQKLGFTPTALTSVRDEIAAQKKSDRAELIRLAVAAACAGNIMTFSFANYFGNTGSLRSVFSVLSFLLYLPVVTYVAYPFYVGAINSLRRKEISIDLPMAIASLAGFIFSSIQLFRGQENIYFDSLSGFLFLILISRWSQRRLQRNFLNLGHLTDNFGLERVRIVQAGQISWTKASSLKIGDHIHLESGETVPVDGDLISQRAQISLSWLSGESKPLSVTAGSRVPAGSKVVSTDATLQVRELIRNTEFGKILATVERFSLSKNRIISLSDRWAQRLLVFVFTVATIYLAAAWSTGAEDAIGRALALIIVACPCAMAFGTPLALASALKKARSQGILIRDANVLEKCENIKTLFFDKTGTLTESELSLEVESEAVAAKIRSIVLTLESYSQHPMAYAFRQAFPDDLCLIAENWKETPGEGVSATIENEFYELKRNPSVGMSCTLFKNGESLKTFNFRAKILPGALDTLTKLRLKGFKTVLISGDSEEVTRQIGQALNFKNHEVLFGMSPTDKANLVAQTPHAMMIGDGINDSLAMIKADVGVAVAGSVESALKSSQIYLNEKSLDRISFLFKLSRETLNSIKINLSLSVIYNVIAGTLALTGFITPLVAALLMPLSSGVILVVTWVRGRK
jgi:P-type Cu+ transporter